MKIGKYYFSSAFVLLLPVPKKVNRKILRQANHKSKAESLKKIFRQILKSLLMRSAKEF